MAIGLFLMTENIQKLFIIIIIITLIILNLLNFSFRDGKWDRMMKLLELPATCQLT